MRSLPDPATLDDLGEELDRQFQRDLELAYRVVDRLRRDDRLSEQSWWIYRERVLLDRPAAEVAKELGLNVRTVYQRCYRVAKLLAREGKRVAPDGVSD
jgi:hypothetical protein